MGTLQGLLVDILWSCQITIPELTWNLRTMQWYVPVAGICKACACFKLSMGCNEALPSLKLIGALI